ncbi:type 1 fimbrial protein [Cronobacter turicensis]|uniref:fimbrial protein n=1 Tax=Cronobacter turicensis TaxID=413502 RepID=UPI0011ACD3C0|nr:fimbrial protein [Cronobacter turicensis]EKY3118314.1 type 1 fimbrial protein [Cronobacter turicensis]ELU8454031.1 type 1 fimbrial protein [Cronobacter turicensis]ELY4111422.1 type 1 fimbrial protein [Cronobacter turicensis]ELY4217788.1 type 1 fimbrial protein [Cronobacter turicensis]EMA1791463.1 type 1 fimbrial protein [Cronobacter turicensis]
MKKSILGLTVSALFMVGAAQASTNPNDVSATLSVTGTVVEDITQVCTVSLDKSSVALSNDVGDLINQGDRATANGSERVNLQIIGGDQCQTEIAAGHMAYKFTGMADNGDGTVLTNTDTSATAAQGVGVGIYDYVGNVLKVNQDTLPATTEGNAITLQMVKLTGQEAIAGNVLSSVTIEIERL